MQFILLFTVLTLENFWKPPSCTAFSVPLFGTGLKRCSRRTSKRLIKDVNETFQTTRIELYLNFIVSTLDGFQARVDSCDLFHDTSWRSR